MIVRCVEGKVALLMFVMSPEMVAITGAAEKVLHAVKSYGCLRGSSSTYLWYWSVTASSRGGPLGLIPPDFVRIRNYSGNVNIKIVGVDVVDTEETREGWIPYRGYRTVCVCASTLGVWSHTLTHSA